MTDEPSDDSTTPDHLSETTAALVRGAVELDRFDTPQDGIEAAVTEFFENRPELRVEAAVAAYAVDEEMSVGAAAQIADIDRFTMRERLSERDELRLGPDSIEAAREDAETARDTIDSSVESDSETVADSRDGEEEETDRGGQGIL